MDVSSKKANVVVIGGGFTGLSAAYELTRLGVGVTVLEKDDEVGGMAASFKINGYRLDKFYHHFFNSDRHLIHLVDKIGLTDRLRYAPTKTSIYLGKSFYRLSSPLDVLRFRPLGLADRLRLGMLVLWAKHLVDWQTLESLTAEQWLVSRCGKQVYQVVWEPLLRAKFGSFAREVSAVWFWNKLVLRGGSRNFAGQEVLGYFNGSFGTLAQALADKVVSFGGEVLVKTPVTSLIVKNGCVRGVLTPCEMIDAEAVISTPALPVIANLLEGNVTQEYIGRLRRIKYLANICLVLELGNSLSDIYWLNINDSNIPFTGIVEHTNFMSVESCAGRHVVYLSKYLEQDSNIYNMSEKQLLEFFVPHIRRIFEGFDKSKICGHHVWRAPYAQPLIEQHYSKLICPTKTPVKGFYIATMAQVYPQDRGVNYAVGQGRQVAQITSKYLGYSETGMEK
jgi:protoporphyrinogen oxidase